MLKSIFFLLCASMVFAQTKLLSVTATLPAGVARKNVRLVVLVDGSTAEHPCSPTGVADNEPMFECTVNLDARSGVFIFRIPGYKPYSIRAADLDKTVNRGFAVLPLGAVHPADDEEPRIENVVLTRSQDGDLRYRIRVNNLSRNQILVTQIKMEASVMRACGASASHRMPPNSSTHFTISDRLSLTPYKTGKFGITATISDQGEGTDFPFQVTGTGVFSSCAASNFKLSAPVNFTIPGQGLFEIELLMPAGRKRPATGGDSSSTLATGAVVRRFPEIHFALLTADKGHPEISTDYSN